MSTAARILGIAGGVLGIMFAGLGLAIGGAGIALGSNVGTVVTALSIVAMGLAAAAIAGAVFVETRPLAAFTTLLVAGVAGFVCISVFWLLPGLLLVTASMLTFKVRKERLEVAEELERLARMRHEAQTAVEDVTADVP